MVEGLDARESERLLLELLEEHGTDWTRQSGYIRFRIRRGALCWEADCLCERSRILIYGRYPFAAADRRAALELCNRANLRLCRAALLLLEDGQILCRTAAELDDLYDAAFRLRRALEDNISAAARWWGPLARLADGAKDKIPLR